MKKWSLESLLPRRTKTWQDKRYATTIDLMLVSQELASSVLKCKIHDTEHGSDHRASERYFDVQVPDHATQPRLLFKNAPWNAIRERYALTLPGHIEDGGDRPQRQLVHMPELTLGKIECCLMKTKQWKVAGEDGLPAGLWRQVWPAVKESVRHLFQTLLDKGTLLHQWKAAKIIPLKKPNKDDYTPAKAWRSISLLSTLGKLLEAVVAERISFAVANHFGARKQRSAEQALLLLQERVYTAWRGRKVVSLVSFRVKGAYNGVL
jgi:hypothetical protein